MKKALVLVLILTFVVSLASFAEKKKTPEPQPVVTVEQLIANGEYQKAVDLGNKMLGQGQETAGLLVNIGVAHYKLKDNVNALAFLEKAFTKASDPLAPDTQLQLQALLFEATIYHETAQEEKVAEVYGKALAIAPEDKEVLFSYGHIVEAKDKAKSLELYDKLVLIDPLYKNVGYDAGVFALQNNDLDRAERYLTLAKDKSPENEEILLALSQVLLKKKSYETAIPVLEKVSTITTKEVLKPALLQRLALCQLQTKKPMECIQTADKILAIRPNDESAILFKAESYYEMKDLKNSAAAAEQLLALNPNHENAMYRRAVIYLEQKNNDKAKPLLEKIAATTKDQNRKSEVQDYLKQMKKK
jgi:tetratricopeptide (TPR) repeat protein